MSRRRLDATTTAEEIELCANVEAGPPVMPSAFPGPLGVQDFQEGRAFGVSGPMSCQELIGLATDYLEDALAPAEPAAFLPGSGPEARRLLTVDRKAAPIRS